MKKEFNDLKKEMYTYKTIIRKNSEAVAWIHTVQLSVHKTTTNILAFGEARLGITLMQQTPDRTMY